MLNVSGILQMMACLQAKKSLAYFTFGDKGFCDRIYAMYTLLSSEKVTVGKVEFFKWTIQYILVNVESDIEVILIEYLRENI